MTTAYSPEPATGLTPAQLAFSFGFRASATGKPKSDNPHLMPGDLDWRPSTELGDGWLSGWLNGQGRTEADLSWHLHTFRGGD